MIYFKQSGGFKNLERFFKKTSSINYHAIFSKYGAEGVSALASVTPIDSGDTRNSWSYSVETSPRYSKLTWYNSNISTGGTPIAILLQYGHATNNGGYVQGRDFINPAIMPIFEKIANELWKEVTST